MKKSITLVELILAMTLLAVIVLGAGALHIASGRFLRTSERKAQVLNEAAYVLNHIARNALMGIGNETLPGLNIANTPYNEQMLLIRQDSNISGTVDLADVLVGYARQNSTLGWGNDTVIFMCNNTVGSNDCTGAEVVRREQLTSHASGFNFTIANNTANISVVIRYNPLKPVDSRDNPQIELNTTVVAPGSPL